MVERLGWLVYASFPNLEAFVEGPKNQCLAVCFSEFLERMKAWNKGIIQGLF